MRYSTFVPWFALMALVAVGGMGCAAQATPSEEEAQTTQPNVLRYRSVLEEGGSYTDTLARCRFVLPAGAYQIDAIHFSDRLPATQLRHQLTISPLEKGKSLARIDIFELNPPQDLDAWVHEHLGYLLDENATASPVSVGLAHTPGVLIRRMRSPQAFASRTIVTIRDGRVFVITGSDVDDGQRKAAFDRLVDGFDTMEEAQ